MTLPVTDDPTDIDEAWRTAVMLKLVEHAKRLDEVMNLLRVVAAELQRVAGKT